MNIIVSGGGTGGHIYPAISIAKKLKKRFNDNINIYYVGTPDGMEKELATREGFNYREVRVKGMPRNLSMQSIKSLKELTLGLIDSRKIIKELKPNLIIATGGYVCFPIAYMGKIYNIPICIHEQNAYPGITNKILSRYANKIFITFNESKRYFKHPERTILTGNPIREELISIDKREAYDYFGLDENKPVIVSFGGSGGQASLNDAMIFCIDEISKDDEIQLIHITGKKHYDSFLKKLENLNMKINNNIKIYPYLYELPKAMSIATLIITSAGAITLAEISALGKASILIPKAYTAENHQEYNAKVFEDAKASIVIKEQDLSGEELIKTIFGLIKDKDKLSDMGINASKLMDINATDNIVEELIQYLR